jgi:DNA (cytosine-5)-methyltransferase 1
MMEAYRTNHNPKYSYLEPIQTFKLRKDLPKELYNLDILDGSPPCSSFSMAGNREKDWGKEKKFREGQAEQVLDNLFFDFIDLAKELQPKVVFAENVKGLLLGNAKEYVRKIYREFDLAGYYCQHWLLDASKMGVPQRRERVFFICLRKDLAGPHLEQMDLFTIAPKINIEFNEEPILYEQIEDFEAKEEHVFPILQKLLPLAKEGQILSEVHEKGHMFNYNKADRKKVLPTITAHINGGGTYHYETIRPLSDLENCRAGTYPIDYNFCTNKTKYLIGMSVPPVMTAQIATEIYNQWLKNLT